MTFFFLKNTEIPKFYKFCKHIYSGEHIASPLKGLFEGLRRALELKPIGFPGCWPWAHHNPWGGQTNFWTQNSDLGPAASQLISTWANHCLLCRLPLSFPLCKVGLLIITVPGPGGGCSLRTASGFCSSWRLNERILLSAGEGWGGVGWWGGQRGALSDQSLLPRPGLHHVG